MMKDPIHIPSEENPYDFFKQFVDTESADTLLIATTNVFNVVNHHHNVNAIVNLSRMNDVRYINKFLEGVNQKLQNNDTFICCVETIQAKRKKSKFNKIPAVRNIVFTAEFIVLRVFPKVWGLKRIYFFLTGGRKRLLSKAEMLGRLVSCGFDIEEYQTINDVLYIISKKINEPEYNMNASYGPLYKMPRVGKNGKIIGVYKFRTMHPYAEYLQEYIINKHGYSDTGKPKDDFRLTPWGRVFRKYWLDEVPQLINFLKLELKLVGVRPVSQFYFDQLPQNIKDLRAKHKPGLIPPYVSLNRKSSVDEVLKAEMEYMIEKNKNPYFTDTKYFFKAIFNILFRGKRSA